MRIPADSLVKKEDSFVKVEPSRVRHSPELGTAADTVQRKKRKTHPNEYLDQEQSNKVEAVNVRVQEKINAGRACRERLNPYLAAISTRLVVENLVAFADLQAMLQNVVQLKEESSIRCDDLALLQDIEADRMDGHTSVIQKDIIDESSLWSRMYRLEDLLKRKLPSLSIRCGTHSTIQKTDPGPWRRPFSSRLPDQGPGIGVGPGVDAGVQ
jgi:hypothetical protein